MQACCWAHIALPHYTIILFLIRFTLFTELFQQLHNSASYFICNNSRNQLTQQSCIILNWFDSGLLSFARWCPLRFLSWFALMTMMCDWICFIHWTIFLPRLCIMSWIPQLISRIDCIFPPVYKSIHSLKSKLINLYDEPITGKTGDSLPTSTYTPEIGTNWSKESEQIASVRSQTRFWQLYQSKDHLAVSAWPPC